MLSKVCTPPWRGWGGGRGCEESWNPGMELLIRFRACAGSTLLQSRNHLVPGSDGQTVPFSGMKSASSSS